MRVRQVPPRSEAQEFMQRLHAFLNIKQLMKKEKESEAKEIALRSNFVTSLTSLVVVKPCEGERTTDLEESFEEPPSRGGRSAQSYGHGSYGSGSYRSHGLRRKISSRSGKWSANRSKKVGRSAQRRKHSSRRYVKRKQTKRKNIKKSKKTSQKKTRSKSRYEKKKQKKGKKKRSLKQARNAVQNQESGSGYAADAYEYEDDTEYEDSGSGSLESNEIDEEACSLQLYSQTYHRGAEMNTTKSNPDLGSFTDQAVSASLEGDCCWTLFEDRNFRSVGLICR